MLYVQLPDSRFTFSFCVGSLTLVTPGVAIPTTTRHDAAACGCTGVAGRVRRTCHLGSMFTFGQLFCDCNSTQDASEIIQKVTM